MEILLLIVLPVLMGASVFLFSFSQTIQRIMLTGTASLHLVAVFNIWLYPHVSFNSFMGIDAVSRLVLTIISTLFFIISIYLCGFLIKEKVRRQKVTIGCLLFLLAAMTLVSVSRHMGLLWIGVEATTLLSAPLINYHHSQRSIEATWKYLLISSLGIAMALLGTFFLAITAADRTTIFLDDLFSHATSFSLPWLKMSVIFLVIGYGTKMGLAPVHTWKPDAYGESPAPVGALMAGALTSCGFLGFFRVAQICSYAHIGSFYSSLFILMGVLSLAIAAIFIMGQKDFSRLLGYSSIEHMGIIVLGLGLGGQAVWASFYHLINNAFIKGMIFLAAGNIYSKYKTKEVGGIQGSIHAIPVSSVFLLVSFVAVMGFPPFGIFYSELLIFKESLAAHHYGVAFLYFLFLTVVFFGFARIVLGMVFGKVPDMELGSTRENMFRVFPLAILTVILCVISLVFPAILSSVISEASALLGGQ